MKKECRFDILDFPAGTFYDGLITGCGGLGLTIWGSKKKLFITVGQSDLWDHRGGLPWTGKQNFRDIRAALEKNDEKKIRELFAEKVTGNVRRPSLLPFARVVLHLPAGSRFEKGLLDRTTGLVHLPVANGSRRGRVTIAAAEGRRFGCSGLPRGTRVELVPAFRLSQDLVRRGFAAPEEYDEKDFSCFRQALPADPSAALVMKKTRGGFSAVCLRGVDDEKRLRAVECPPFPALRQASGNWWRAFWRDAPEIELDNIALERLFCRALFKYGAMTDPAGPPPGLQGPWLEDHALPPWQGDYHFNINFQMCVSPGLPAGKFDHVKPALDLVLGWKDKLARNAALFAGVRDGFMLPHAVDDRCTCMGGFWTGCIDHASSAWMAHLMYRYCLYTCDRKFLAAEVMDFMVRVFRVFRAMMDEDAQGRLSLPVSVSPEYNACQMDAWGRNASFQLAAVHALLTDLREGARLLGKKPDPAWKKMADALPRVTVTKGESGEEIALWENQPLEESHRHLSHLAGITPFGTLDPDSERDRALIDNADLTLLHLGMGRWAGWSFPWASQIKTRLGNADAALLMLDLWERTYTTATGLSLYFPRSKMITMPFDIREVMQMDAECGCLSALFDLFAYHEREVIFFFRGIPARQRAAFRDIRLPYGLRASGRMGNGRMSVTLTAEKEDVRTLVSLRGGEKIPVTLKKGQSTTISGKIEKSL